MTADGWHSIGGSACKQHTATTALVLWNYNIALEPKCMLLEVTPMLLHRYLVSAVFFKVFGWHISFVWRFLNGVIVKKTKQKKTWEM